MRKRAVFSLIMAAVFLLGLAVPAGVAGAHTSRGNPPADSPLNNSIPGRYIVMFNDWVDPVSTSAELGKQHGLNVGHIYLSAIKGFSCYVPAGRLAALQADPRVQLVEPDLIAHTTGQIVPTGVARIEADLNGTANIDGVDDRVNVDIAIIDTGIDTDHPDLNVVGGRHFYSRYFGLLQYQDNKYDDDNGHGSHVAGIAAALDNDTGVVGIAPGARLWAIKVLDRTGSGYVSDIIAGVDWVKANADKIEVANMSLSWTGYSEIAWMAIHDSVMAGVVYFVAAGNDAKDICGTDGKLKTNDDIQPAAYCEVATVSAMVDSNGMPGGFGGATDYGVDDSFASFSNFNKIYNGTNIVNSPGLGIDLIMPGVNIYSTYKNGGYATMSGTSMASPHAAGLAALYIAENSLFNTQQTVDDNGLLKASNVRQALIDAGMPQSDATNGLTVPNNDPDGYKENIGWAGPGNSPSNEAPAVATQPNDQTVVEGQTASFTAAASGTPTPTIQWQLSTDGGSSWANIVGATSTTYTTPATTIDMNGYQYQAIFTNSAGSATTVAATLTVNPVPVAPQVTTQPQDQTVVEGQTASFAAAASGTPNPTVQWQLSTDGGSSWTNIVGASSTTYTTPATTIDMNGYQYQAIFTNSAGSDTTVAATLTVNPVPANPTVSVSSIGYATEGGRDGTAHLLVTVSLVDAVAGASVSINILGTNSFLYSKTGITGTDGTVTFKITNVPSGTYTTIVTNITAEGLVWDGNTPNNSYTK